MTAPTPGRPDQTVILLGSQMQESTLSPTLEEHGISGPVATVTAGWHEREEDVQALQAHLDGRSENLRLYGRAEDAFAKDPDLASTHRERQLQLQELQRLYDLRVGHAMKAVDSLARRSGSVSLIEEEQRSAMEALRLLDSEHLERIGRIHADFEGRLRFSERGIVQHHQGEIAQILDGCAALAIAGGHVATLLNRLRMFSVADLVDSKTVIGWSAGAMVLTERVILYHDSPAQGAGNPEVFERGLALCRGVVALPLAKKRLRLGDRDRVARLARRFAPDRCVTLDDRARLTVGPSGWSTTPETACLQLDGRVEELLV